MKREDSTVKMREFGFSTLAIHAGQEPDVGTGAIMTPIFQTSTYVQESPGVNKGYEYSRTKNPTRTALQDNLAALEGGEFGVCFSSGCAAADAIFHQLSAGDHVVVGDDVYGGTYRILTRVFKQLGVDATFVDLTRSENLVGAITGRTKMVWLESPTNPLLKVSDIEVLSRIAHGAGVCVVVDNTFASPYLQQPLRLGADLVVHSSTKYIGGHSDVIGGVVVTNSKDWAEKLAFVQNAVGAVPSPLDCFLLLRSTKTLALRMERHVKNAQAIAEYLLTRSDVVEVIYPGLESHPQFSLAQRQMKYPGAMISMRFKGGREQALEFVKKTRIFSLAESLGGVESLVSHPVTMTHASIPTELRNRLGITDNLVRLSVGVEDLSDLLWDLQHSLP